MSQNRTFQRVAGVAEARVDGETILMAPTDGRCHALRGAASTIWELLAEPHTAGQLVDRLTVRFAVEPSDCARDVESALSQFERAGLLTSSEG